MNIYIYIYIYIYISHALSTPFRLFLFSLFANLNDIACIYIYI